ncbi:lisH domain-containing protein FOPNL [Fopius arisanus]|uniref:LisH domain-containing protein FOPNL n=1 Tax=Fopius arisanus TaxID=64838 RepID=A0A9R1SWP5_9HYME|nr:PREDICTED: lisH domain-containing protein FOPNL [Fopius arisanus]XP_011298528.1 PREDICTED: lisH domain-containing protein FOPNL [Fopius arisanus]
MATEKDLVNAVRDSLEAGGELGRIKAEMRSEVMKLLDGSSAANRTKRPESPRDVIILNELIREYLDWIGYKYTLNVFISECEFGKQPLDRTFLAKDLGVQETDSTNKLPLLFSLVETFRSLNTSHQE